MRLNDPARHQSRNGAPVISSDAGDVSAQCTLAKTISESFGGAANAPLLSLSRTLSGELISRGVRVNAVSPGPISTPLYSKLGAADTRELSVNCQNDRICRK